MSLLELVCLVLRKVIEEWLAVVQLHVLAVLESSVTVGQSDVQ